MKANLKSKRKLVVITFLTLDGVMQAPGGRKEDAEAGFKYGGWQMPFVGDKGKGLWEVMRKADGLLIGRKTYDIFAHYWPTKGKNVPGFGPYMNNITKYVASKTLRKTDWENSYLLKGPVAKAVARIKREKGKDIIIFGSGNLCQTLMRHHLIDEYFLMIHPLALGKGKRLLNPDGPKQDLRLLKSKITQDGILVLTYKVKH